MGLSFSIGLSILTSSVIYSNYVINLVFFSTPFLILFLYNFPENIQKKETTFVSIICFLSSFLGYFYYIYQTIGSKTIFNFRAQTFFFENEAQALFWGSFIFFLQNVWATILLIRKKYQYKKLQRFSKEFSALLGASIVPLMMSIIVLLVSRKVLPWDIYHFSLSTLSSIAFFIYLLVYINNTSAPTSFKKKLVFIFFIAGMIFSTVISFVTASFQIKREISYREDLILILSNIVGVKTIHHLPETVGFIIRQDSSAKIILYKNTEFTQLNFSNVSIHQEIIGNNTIRYTYFNINDPKTFSILNLFSKDGINYTVGFSYVSLRENISDYVTYFILLMFMSYALILVGVPYFYRMSIQKRLTALLNGVKQVNQGNYHIRISVPIEDEIGFLAKSFNGMVLAIRRSTIEHEKLISIKQELQLAKKIQMATLPDKIPVINGLSIYAKYIPMGDIGGDFYDFHKINDSRVCVFIADVSGHGIPAAMGASMVKLVFSQQYSNFKDPAKLLHGMNESLFLRLNHSFVTAAYMFIDTHKGIIKYSNAGHPAFIINKREKKTIEEVFIKGHCIGFKSNGSYHNLEVKISKGDRIILYTDGITECMNPKKELFGEERFKAFINQNTNSTAEVLVGLLDTHLKEWKQSHGKFEDDFTIIVLDID